MFLMTANIIFEGFKPVKPSSLKWNINIDNYSDTATIVVPATCRLKDKEGNYSVVPTGQQICEGTKVEIWAGYDGKNDLQFKGFVKRLNFKKPLEIECEGYSYPLRRQMINKSFGKTTVKEVLNHIIEGTGITLSPNCPDKIDFEPKAFENFTAVQVLDFLKRKYLLTIFFEYDKLYVGWRATYSRKTIKMRLNWNVVDSDALLFNTYTGSIVHIQLVSRAKTGVKQKVKSSNNNKPGNVKVVKTLMQSMADKLNAANDRQILENQKGYTGSITGFLKPFARVGDTVQIIDVNHKERNGSYFIESVEGSFSTGGGRQKIGIGFSVKANG